ncbi:MAG: hypothetical protein J1F07_08565 [Muribaculaceae bacterium]|nr:hypothetical protein [Muribaculaceae bacterium]
MKKLALSLAVLFAVGLVSCGGNKEKECDTTCDTTPVEVAVVEEAVVADSANDTAAAVEAAAEEAPAAEAAN